jgi:hypothetical protein
MGKRVLVCAFALSMLGIGCAPYVGVIASAEGRAHVFSSKTAYVCQTGEPEGQRAVCVEVKEK